MSDKFEKRREKIAKMRAEKAKETKLSIAAMFDDMKPYYESLAREAKPSILFGEMSKSITPKIVVDKDVPPGMPYVTSGPLWTPGPPSPRYYTGIGSRETPVEVQAFMRFLAITLAKDGWVLRSGGAEGADSAFEEGCDDAEGKKEIYLPWKGFNGNKSKRFALPRAATKIAEEHHPAWERLTPTARKLHTRNVRQIFGRSMADPKLSEFVVCWTKDGKGKGGTGQAIRIARAYGVPVHDLGHGSIEIASLGIRLGLDLRVEFETWRSA